MLQALNQLVAFKSSWRGYRVRRGARVRAARSGQPLPHLHLGMKVPHVHVGGEASHRHVGRLGRGRTAKTAVTFPQPQAQARRQRQYGVRAFRRKTRNVPKKFTQGRVREINLSEKEYRVAGGQMIAWPRDRRGKGKRRRGGRFRPAPIPFSEFARAANRNFGRRK